jgi:anti-sigma regulatory factor (Ser/Thr protein kinase)
MEVSDHVRLEVRDASAAGHARRVVTELAERAGLGPVDVERARVVVTEAATNLVKHANGGELLLHGVHVQGHRGVSVLALDTGHGMASVGEAMRDGFSTVGTAGTGLGAMRRLSSVFDAFATSGGFAVLCIVWPEGAPRSENGLVAGGINVPHPGETVSGDGWSIGTSGGATRIVMSDGLGHGAAAAEASALAMEAFRRTIDRPPVDALHGIHETLRATRGAAVALADVDRDRGLVRFAGLGNIAGTIVTGEATRSVVSQHGTAGYDVRRLQEFTYPWQRDSMLVLHSDGLTSRWTLDRYPGLIARHPMLIAGVLYRDFKRGRDDASAVVLREAA